jgi:hypothetical protein
VELLENQYAYKAMTAAANPYGDGFASTRIAQLLQQIPDPVASFARQDSDSSRAPQALDCVASNTLHTGDSFPEPPAEA